MTLPPFPAHLARPAMNPVTVDFLAKVNRARHVDEISLGDAMELVRMIQAGDLVHVDTLAAVAEAQGFRLTPVVVPVEVRTAEAIYTGWEYAASRGEL